MMNDTEVALKVLKALPSKDSTGVDSSTRKLHRKAVNILNNRLSKDN
jgi:hypothetical protein